MRKYYEPIIAVSKFDVESVVTTSAGGGSEVPITPATTDVLDSWASNDANKITASADFSDALAFTF